MLLRLVQGRVAILYHVARRRAKVTTFIDPIYGRDQQLFQTQRLICLSHDRPKEPRQEPELPPMYQN